MLEINVENLQDVKYLQELCNTHSQYPSMLFGTDDRGEDVSISINSDSVVLMTYQDNNVTRENIYRVDGSQEELYYRDWD